MWDDGSRLVAHNWNTESGIHTSIFYTQTDVSTLCLIRNTIKWAKQNHNNQYADKDLSFWVSRKTVMHHKIMLLHTWHSHFSLCIHKCDTTLFNSKSFPFHSVHFVWIIFKLLLDSHKNGNTEAIQIYHRKVSQFVPDCDCKSGTFNHIFFD